MALVVVFALAQNLSAQSGSPLYDSIVNVLSHAKEDTATCHRLLTWTDDLSPAEHKTAVYVSKWCVTTAKRIGDEKCLTEAWYTLGRCYQIIDDYKTALNYFKIVARLAEKNKLYKTQAALYDCYASIYAASREFTLAEKYYQKSIALAKKHNFKLNLAASYYNLASLYYEAKTDSDYVQKTLTNVNIALSVADTNLNWDVIAYSLWIKAMVYDENLNNDSSVFFIDKAFRIAKAHDLTDFYNAYYQHKGIMLCKKKRFKDANDLFIKGLKNAELTHSYIWQYNFYELLALTAVEQGDYKSAYEYRLLHKTYYDSLVNTENFAKVNDLETALKLEKKEKERKISELLLQKSEQRQFNLLVIIISIGVLVFGLIIFVFLLVRNVRAKKEAYLKLQQKNIEILHQGEQLAKLSGEITKYQSQMNPHFVFNALNSIQGFVVNNEKEKTLTQLANFSKLMRTTLNNSNHALITLNNEVEYLKTYIDFEQERFRNKISFSIEMNVDANETMIPPMMIQPLLENSLKHARLGELDDAHLKLEINEVNGMLKVAVTDNGKGILGDGHEIIRNSHSMSIIQSRIKLVFEQEKTDLPDNYFTITTVPILSRGTRVEFFLPVLSEF